MYQNPKMCCTVSKLEILGFQHGLRHLNPHCTTQVGVFHYSEQVVKHSDDIFSPQGEHVLPRQSGGG